MKIRTMSSLFLGAMLGMAAAPIAQGVVIYSDDFSSAAGLLQGTSPDVAPEGVTWASSPLWNANGTKTAVGSGNAFVPFKPLPGNVYTLSLDVDPKISASNDWFALGFSGTSNVAGAWHTANPTVTSWMLNRENDASTSAVQAFHGPSTGAGTSHDFTPDKVGPVNMQVVLNTQGAQWTTEWLVDGVSIRGPVAASPNFATQYNFVGFSGNNTVTGSIDNFSLTAAADRVAINVFNSGVDANGNVLPVGAFDPHYTITSTPGGPFGSAVVQLNHPAWLANNAAGTPGSSWISTTATGTDNIAPGEYVYETTFDLTNLSGANAQLLIAVAADNSVNILLNGEETGFTHSGFAAFSAPFLITSGFIEGINTLQFVLTNAGTAPNPGGLRVQILGSTTTIPEPGTLSLLGLAIAGLTVRRRRVAVMV